MHVVNLQKELANKQRTVERLQYEMMNLGDAYNRLDEANDQIRRLEEELRTK